MVKYLHSKAGNLYRSTGGNGKLPLHQAATTGKTEMVRFLLGLGIPVDMEMGYMKATPLVLACETGHIDVVVLLLQRGANPNKVSFSLISSLLLTPSSLLPLPFSLFPSPFPPLSCFIFIYCLFTETFGWCISSLHGRSKRIFERGNCT